MNGGYVYRDRVRPSDAGANVLAYHVARFTHSNEAAWRASIEAGAVRVNGRLATCADRLQVGDELEFHRAPWTEPNAPTTFGELFEDDDVLALDKPSGLQVLPAGPFQERTLLHLVRASRADRATCSPAHRLGRGTSGIILFGKTERARTQLARQFRERIPTKTYLARVAGTALPTSCVARHPIGKVAHGPMMIYVARADGAEAHTRVRVLRREGENALVAAQPVTGRPDQIRIHLAALGAPIVGDPLFGVGGGAKSDATPGTCGYWLHAARVRFRHPTSGAWLKLDCAVPWDHTPPWNSG